MLIVQILGMWLVFLIIAIINGGIREKIIEKHIGELPAHIVSTVLFSVLIFIVTAIYINYKNITDSKILLAIGFAWVVLTISFEFLFFHYVAGNPWSQLLADYNIMKGRIFPLVLITTLLSPIIASRIFNK
ncbi:MAG: hypothetical protein LWX54_14440 [Deltaproteobacteria bacterium]|jgi:hypothetical protein|nr:hypothetical protein [Deltaproteobacteria bacterium]